MGKKEGQRLIVLIGESEGQRLIVLTGGERENTDRETRVQKVSGNRSSYHS